MAQCSGVACLAVRGERCLRLGVSGPERRQPWRKALCCIDFSGPGGGYTGTVSIRERLQTMRSQVLDLARRHGARNVRLIGSVARGEAGPASDLDLLVDLEQGRSLLDHAALMIELEQLLGCKVDVATEQGLRPRVRERVLSEAVPL